MRILPLFSDIRRSDVFTCRLIAAGFSLVQYRNVTIPGGMARVHEPTVVITDRTTLEASSGGYARLIEELDPQCVVALVGADMTDRIAAWGAGAQVCVYDDLDLQELVAALGALGRKLAGMPLKAGAMCRESETQLQYRDTWHLENEDLTLVTPTGAVIDVSPYEGYFLQLLIANHDRVVMAHDGLWLGRPRRLVKLKTLRSLLCRLRRKVKRHGWNLPIRNIYGCGYSFVLGNQPQSGPNVIMQPAGEVVDGHPRLSSDRYEVNDAVKRHSSFSMTLR